MLLDMATGRSLLTTVSHQIRGSRLQIQILGLLGFSRFQAGSEQAPGTTLLVGTGITHSVSSYREETTLSDPPGDLSSGEEDFESLLGGLHERRGVRLKEQKGWYGWWYSYSSSVKVFFSSSSGDSISLMIISVDSVKKVRNPLPCC
jgi:hypothetical protein